ncbi:taste receptor type 2 member 14-like [Perognathus longimembris pacificus]|uniref:taste receptor type 2 member 14-like n=1 Tax=Perognathus longimembris pacificus TaxID=214514 RepID=UPI002019B3B6|nr:taste receptor type 2 member 14-like [Perognathus longimembris pacificus]
MGREEVANVLSTGLGIFLIILGLVFLVGNLGNGFLALVNGVDCVRRRKISFTDLILPTLGICRPTSPTPFSFLKWRVRRVISLMILGSLVILCINGFLVNTAINLAISLIGFVLLIFSLWTQCKKMQYCGQGLRDASTTAHVRVLDTVIAFHFLKDTRKHE